MRLTLPVTTSLLMAVLCSGGTAVNPARQHLYTFNYESVLGTSLELKIGAPSLRQAEVAEGKALDEIDRLGKILSAWDNDSEFSRWMRTSNRPVRVSAELFEVLGLFDKWRDLTGGALDASAEVVTRLWKAAEQEGRLPSSGERLSAVGRVRQAHWYLDPETQTATHLSNVPLVLSSFTKSYIADRAAEAALASGGVTSAVLNIGGDIVVRGDWAEPVDIANPAADAENDQPIERLMVHDRTVATSGNYRRGVAIGGKHYSHIVDPRTGMPCEEVISSTVVARNATDAGAMATAFSVLSPNDSRQLAASVPGTEFLLVMNDGHRVESPGWRALQMPGTVPQVALARPRAVGANVWDSAFELIVTVELARLEGGARRPYMAVWIEDQDKFPVRTLALWYNKDKFLPELRAWSLGAKLRTLAVGSDITHSVSSATRGAGKYTLKWDGKDDGGKLVKPGKYTVFIEVTREHGGYALLRQEVDFSGIPTTIPLKGNTEVASASVEYRKITQ